MRLTPTVRQSLKPHSISDTNCRVCITQTKAPKKRPGFSLRLNRLNRIEDSHDLDRGIGWNRSNEKQCTPKTPNVLPIVQSQVGSDQAMCCRWHIVASCPVQTNQTISRNIKNHQLFLDFSHVLVLFLVGPTKFLQAAPLRTWAARERLVQWARSVELVAEPKPFDSTKIQRHSARVAFLPISVHLDMFLDMFRPSFCNRTGDTAELSMQSSA